MSKLIVFRWRPQPCPNVYDSNKSEWTSVNCRQGDKCRYFHNNREYQYHVLTYKTVLCLNLKNGGVCPQGLMCAFAHSQSERRKTKQFQVISNNSSCSTYLTLFSFAGRWNESSGVDGLLAVVLTTITTDEQKHRLGFLFDLILKIRNVWICFAYANRCIV